MVYTSPSTCGRIVALRDSGRSVTDLSQEFQKSRSTIYDIIRCYKQYQTCYPRAKPGRPRQLKPSDHKFCTLQIDRGRSRNAADLQRSYFPNVSAQTIRRALRSQGLHARTRRQAPYLSAKHIRARKAWAQEMKDWDEGLWRRVIFSDESKFNLFRSDGREWCWRRTGDAHQHRYIQPVKKYGGGSVMVWGCITEHGVGRLCHIEGIMRAQEYIEILKDSLLPTIHNTGQPQEVFIFQQDNDRKHTSRLATAWIKDAGLKTLPWPAQSPDMSIIEHVWDHLDCKVRARDQQPTTLDGLWKALEEEWYRIDPEFIRGLYDSMPRRVEALRKAKGKNTKY